LTPATYKDIVADRPHLFVAKVFPEVRDFHQQDFAPSVTTKSMEFQQSQVHRQYIPRKTEK